MAPPRHDLLGVREELQALVLCRDLAGEAFDKLSKIRQVRGMPLDEQSGNRAEKDRQGVRQLGKTGLESS